MSAATVAFTGRKAAQASRDALRKAIDSLEQALLTASLREASAVEERNRARQAANDAHARWEEAKDERETAVIKLRAAMARGGAL